MIWWILLLCLSIGLILLFFVCCVRLIVNWLSDGVLFGLLGVLFGVGVFLVGVSLVVWVFLVLV